LVLLVGCALIGQLTTGYSGRRYGAAAEPERSGKKIMKIPNTLDCIEKEIKNLEEKNLYSGT